MLVVDRGKAREGAGGPKERGLRARAQEVTAAGENSEPAMANDLCRHRAAKGIGIFVVPPKLSATLAIVLVHLKVAVENEATVIAKDSKAAGEGGQKVVTCLTPDVSLITSTRTATTSSVARNLNIWLKPCGKCGKNLAIERGTASTGIDLARLDAEVLEVLREVNVEAHHEEIALASKLRLETTAQPSLQP